MTTYTSSPNSLPGIDVDDALKRIGIDWNKYLGLLHRFAEAIRRPRAELRQSIEQQDFESARRLALTISVECMKLCADDLRQQARDLDQAIRNQSSDAATLAGKLEEDLSKLVNAITASDNPFEDADVQDLLGSLYDYGEIELTLLQLESALISHDANLTGDLLNQWERLGIPPELLEGFKQIKSLAAGNSFEDAAAIVNILKSGLPKVS
jgi:HPt (histidine-containing phosphotransfer) domain-containing protein